jgi:hypothetical protein
MTQGQQIGLVMVQQHWKHRDADNQGQSEDNIVLDPLTVMLGEGASGSTSTRREFIFPHYEWQARGARKHAAQWTRLACRRRRKTHPAQETESQNLDQNHNQGRSNGHGHKAQEEQKAQQARTNQAQVLRGWKDKKLPG